MTPACPTAGHDPYSWLLSPSGNLGSCVQGIQRPERERKASGSDVRTEAGRRYLPRGRQLRTVAKAAECGEEHSQRSGRGPIPRRGDCA